MAEATQPSSLVSPSRAHSSRQGVCSPPRRMVKLSHSWIQGWRDFQRGFWRGGHLDVMLRSVP